VWKGQNGGFPKTVKVYIGIFNLPPVLTDVLPPRGELKFPLWQGAKKHLQGYAKYDKINTNNSKRKEGNMKKIALFSLMCCLLSGGAFAGGFHDIEAKDCGFWNENIYRANEKIKFGNKCFECDDDEGDVNDHTFAVWVRSSNKELDYGAKECRLEAGDKWSDRKIPWCDSTDKCRTTYKWGAYQFCSKAEAKFFSTEKVLFVNGGKKTQDNPSTIKNYVGCWKCSQGYVKPNETYTFTGNCNTLCTFSPDMCVPEEMIDCYNAIKRKEPANWNGETCYCGSVNNVAYTWMRKEKKCVSNNEPKTCNDMYKGNQPAIDCCNAGQDWDAKAKKCVCKDKLKEWNSKTKQCVKKAGAPTKPQKPQQTEPQATQPGTEEQKTCTYYFSGTIKCDGKEVEIKGTKEVKVPCVNGVQDNTVVNDIETMFENDTEDLRQIKDELCAGVVENGSTSGTTSSGATVVSTATGDYRSAEAILDRFVSNAESERSVWKTSEGKFNTTRLASDITAGVVLGTVGGVVTGVVIKKNQVKKGFEALHCAVGGQKVAEWGDEFSVGLRR